MRGSGLSRPTSAEIKTPSKASAVSQCSWVVIAPRVAWRALSSSKMMRLNSAGDIPRRSASRARGVGSSVRTSTPPRSKITARMGMIPPLLTAVRRSLFNDCKPKSTTSNLKSLPVDHLPPDDAEADAFVEIQCAVQVLRVDAQGSLFHAHVLEHLQAAGEQGARQAAPPPRAAHRDALGVAALAVILDVFFLVNEVQDIPGHLVAIPGHLPQPGVESRFFQPFLVLFLRRLYVAPMVAEGFLGGVPNSAVVLRRHQAYFQSFRQRLDLDRFGKRSRHMKPIAHRGVALFTE